MAVDHQIVLCTCPDETTAARLADALVQSGLAACVNAIPGVESVYRWRGRLERDREWLLIIKGAAAAYQHIEDTITSLHPYELPEVIAVPIVAGLPAYLAWMNERRDDGGSAA